MRAAGFGFRNRTSEAALREALEFAGGLKDVTALATAAKKAQHPAFLALAATLGLPVLAIAPAALSRQQVLTQSPRAELLYGAGSVAEAAALACFPAARLLGPRSISSDQTATAALAERTEL